MAREHFCRYLPVEGLVGLADLHSLLVASGRDEVEYGLLVAACGESRESHLATQLHLAPHGWAHHSHPAQRCFRLGAGRRRRAELAPGRKGEPGEVLAHC